MAEREPDPDASLPDPDRLRRLEERLEARRKPPQQSQAAISLNHANTAWRMVIELVAGLAVGFGIGFGLDYLLGTQPLFLVLFVLAGMAAGVKVMLGTARELGQPPPGARNDTAAGGDGPAFGGSETTKTGAEAASNERD